MSKQEDAEDRGLPVAFAIIVLALAAWLWKTGHLWVIPAFMFLALCIRAGWWAFGPQNKSRHDRIRHLNMRLHLRLYPGRGFATHVSLTHHFGKRAMVKRGVRIRPSLGKPQLKRDLDAHSVFVGRAHHCRAVRMPCDEHLMVMAEPRTGKTQWMAKIILHYPGPAFVSSTREDLFNTTSGVRAAKGPVAVFNPQGIGHVPSTFRWNVVRGCAEEATAIRRANAFCEAAGAEGVEDSSFWDLNAQRVLAAFFIATDLAGGDLRIVSAWKDGVNQQEPVRVLQAAGKNYAALPLARFLFSQATKTTDTIRMVLDNALGFLSDPLLAECALPEDGVGLDFTDFIRDNGTVYMIGRTQGKTAPIAGIFSAITMEFRHCALLAGSKMEGSRLDPPMGLFPDEATATTKIEIPTLLQDSGGAGIQIFTVVHGVAQLESRFDTHGMQTILDTSAILALPGIKNPDTLKLLSDLCGEMTVRDKDGKLERLPVMTPDMIKHLPDKFGLLIRGNKRPVIVRLGAGWQDKAYRDARKAGTEIATVTAPAALPPGFLSELPVLAAMAASEALNGAPADGDSIGANLSTSDAPATATADIASITDPAVMKATRDQITPDRPKLASAGATKGSAPWRNRHDPPQGDEQPPERQLSLVRDEDEAEDD